MYKRSVFPELMTRGRQWISMRLLCLMAALAPACDPGPLGQTLYEFPSTTTSAQVVAQGNVLYLKVSPLKGSPQLYTLPKSGGEPSLVMPDAIGPTSVDQGNLYVAEASSLDTSAMVHRIPLAGGAPMPLRTVPGITVTVRGGEAFTIARGAFREEILATDLSGTAPPRLLASGVSVESGPWVSKDFVYFAARQEVVDGQSRIGLQRVPRAGGSVTTLLDKQVVSNIRAPIATDEGLYYSNPDGLYFIPDSPVGAQPKLQALGMSCYSRTPVVLDGFIYCVNGYPYYDLVRAPLAGGTVEHLSPLREITSLVLDPHQAYVAQDARYTGDEYSHHLLRYPRVAVVPF